MISAILSNTIYPHISRGLQTTRYKICNFTQKIAVAVDFWIIYSLARGNKSLHIYVALNGDPSSLMKQSLSPYFNGAINYKTYNLQIYTNIAIAIGFWIFYPLVIGNKKPHMYLALSDGVSYPMKHSLPLYLNRGESTRHTNYNFAKKSISLFVLRQR